MLKQVEEKTQSEAVYQKQLVQWARKEESTYPTRNNSIVEIPLQSAKRNSSFFKSVRNFFGGLMRKPLNSSIPTELIPLTETQPLSESQQPLPAPDSQPSSDSHLGTPTLSESQRYSSLQIGTPPSEMYPLTGSHPPSEPHVPIASAELASPV